MKSGLLALLLVALVAPAWADPAKWEKDIAAFEKADAASAPPKGAVLFIGSSSIRLWKTLAQDFPDSAVINRGFGGSEIADSVAFADRIIIPYAPRMIVLYAGGNDINAGKSPDRVVADFGAFVTTVRSKLPDVEIAYISVAGNPARWSQIEKVREVNRRISEIVKAETKLKYINVHDAMLGSDGMPKPDIFVADRLHMNEKGYAIWREVVGPFLPKK
jgi:lysophospholipase L1-like esterase